MTLTFVHHIFMTGKELKELREEAGIKQEELGALVGMHKNTIYGYEKSDKVPAKKAPILKSALEELITEKGLESNLSKIKVNQPLEYFRTKAGSFYEQLPNGRYKIHVPKVPFKAYASFIESFQDEYEEEKLREAFEEVTFTVDQIGHGKYIAFTTANDSMNGGAIYDTPSGAEVLARKLGKHHWQDGFRPTDYGWIIVSHNGIFHKDIENTDTPGKVICKSRNPSPEFSDFPLILDEVHSIWKVIKRTF